MVDIRSIIAKEIYGEKAQTQKKGGNHEFAVASLTNSTKKGTGSVKPSTQEPKALIECKLLYAKCCFHKHMSE